MASGHAYGDLRDAGLDSLAKATRALDVARCSAGVARPDTPAADLGRHQIQDLLRVVVDETFREDEEPIRCFAAWTLAHYTLRKNDLAHVANQDAFARLASLVVDGDLVGAVSRKAKAGDLEANDYALLTVSSWPARFFRVRATSSRRRSRRTARRSATRAPGNCGRSTGW